MASPAATAKRKLVVCGGNGFLGTRICRAAAARGWQVTSLSRSGEPHWPSVSSSPTAPPWSHSITWTKANILQPSTYRTHLASADAVVHSMGILLEADYKGVISGKESPIAGLKRAFSSTKAGTQNPLADRGKEGEGEEYKPQEPDGQLTYEVMNRDSAILLAKEFNNARNSESSGSATATTSDNADSEKSFTPTFIYISAAAGTPILPSRYITTKREAESTIASSFPLLRSIFIRPSFLYDSSRTFTLPIAAAGGLASMANSLVGGRLTWLMGAGGMKPLKADVVGDAVVEALEDEAMKGVVGLQEIEELGTRAWRKNML